MSSLSADLDRLSLPELCQNCPGKRDSWAALRRAWLTNCRTIQEPSDVAEKSGFRCDFPGCRSKTAFKRKPDLQRHMRKHTRKVTFDCPAVNCKYRGRKAFYRPDKLTAHVNAAHDEETLFACPIEGCLSHRTLLSRVLLGLHMRNHEMLPEPYYGYFQALQGCGQKRICPVGKCGKNLMRWRNHLWWDFRQEHILQHTEAERTAFGIEVAAAGFDPVNGYVICPIPNCPERLPHLDAFHHHLIGHTVADPDHFDAWKNVARWYPLSSDAKNCFPWETWYFMDEPSGLVCPTCGEQVRQGRNTHQLDLLKDPEEFKGCREQILRLCPRFASHPIFDDVMPVVQRSGCRKS